MLILNGLDIETNRAGFNRCVRTTTKKRNSVDADVSDVVDKAFSKTLKLIGASVHEIFMAGMFSPAMSLVLLNKYSFDSALCPVGCLLVAAGLVGMVLTQRKL